MPEIYPVNVVVTTDTTLAEEYDQHAISAFLTSGAMSPAEFSRHLEQGAKFWSVVCVNGAGYESAKSQSKQVRGVMKAAVKIKNLEIPAALVLTEAVRLVHVEFNPTIYGMTAAGG